MAQGFLRGDFAKVVVYLSAWTLDKARQHLDAWLQAELAVTAGQEYRVGSRAVSRANLAEIREQIRFWRAEVEKLEAKARGQGSRRVMRIIPRDL